jgi:hypothetical protein
LTFSATQVRQPARQHLDTQRAKTRKNGPRDFHRDPLAGQAQAEDYPATAAWLPARSLSLSESWNPEQITPKVGDSLTRTLTRKAEGLIQRRCRRCPPPT